MLDESVKTDLSRFSQLTDEERASLANKLGYTKIGKELPDNVDITDIIKSLPPEVFKLNNMKSLQAIFISITSLFASLYLVWISPWYLLPFAWALAGTAFTGWFVIGHDCGHRSFHSNWLVEDIVGIFFFMPLIYPFEAWRIKHNKHHADTNKLYEDTAWHPLMESVLDNWTGWRATLYKVAFGTPVKLWLSVGHWAVFHFNLKLYTPKQRPAVMVSIAAVLAFMLIGWPLIIYYFGVVGWFKLWFMPWLGYHFWMTTFTVIHHTAPHIPFKAADQYHAAQAKLGGTVHCDFPRWIEILCHDINVHVPHHVSAKIPWYNLRKATDSLRQNWGQYMTECTFNWRLMRTLITELHLYDEHINYKPFDYKKEEMLYSIQRKVMPNSM